MIEKEHQLMFAWTQAGSFVMKEPKMLVYTMFPYLYNLHIEIQTAMALAMCLLTHHVENLEQVGHTSNLSGRQTTQQSTNNNTYQATNHRPRSVSQRSNGITTINNSGSHTPSKSRRQSQALSQSEAQKLTEKIAQIQADIESQADNDQTSTTAQPEPLNASLFLIGLHNKQTLKANREHVQTEEPGAVGETAGVAEHQRTIVEGHENIRTNNETIGGGSVSLALPCAILPPLSVALPEPPDILHSQPNSARHRCHPYRAPDHCKPLMCSQTRPSSTHRQTNGYSFCQRCPPIVCGLQVPPELRTAVTTRRGHRELARDLQNKEAAKKNRKRAKVYSGYLNEVARQLSWENKCRRAELAAAKLKIVRLEAEFSALRLQQHNLNAVLAFEVLSSPLMSSASTPSASAHVRQSPASVPRFAWAQPIQVAPALDLWALDMAMTDASPAATYHYR
ncbi:hypothetical protein SARC_12124 [Sphaeroforma arctica JP610]|uniref:BZIP domain-containing protein n=1 Tax=Sphaeroforma arctica JP610 TaxID=667725 RepID=A0A0L0FH17_9EUKA|nr:hypothetical protein SARC_12124 [Sphaeroforma arctica JP610]KNC75348.1 hypothetical protein SARC_12124 [Sphaeroforma arctica JP610]|eukprot:XP_014149250.1 hypothetical protein SARC_12124 [Sphaeroforma arctica JP610]